MKCCLRGCMKCLFNDFVVLILRLTLCLSLVSFFVSLIGCKPAQVVTERVLIKSDSTAVLELKEETEFKGNKIMMLESELKQIKEDVFNESNYQHKHEIFYDTTSIIDSLTGKFPISSEIIFENSFIVERKQREYLNQLENTNIEIAELITINSDLKQTVERLQDEKRSVETKERRVLRVGWWVLALVLGLFVFWTIYKFYIAL